MKLWVSWILKVSISSCILFYIFTVVPLSEATRSVSAANESYVVSALVIGLIARYAMACRMKLFTDRQNMSLSVGQIFKINLMTTFYGLFLPGSLAGGAIRWYKLSRPDRKSPEAFASMAFNRLAETTSVVALGAVCWALDAQATSHRLIGASLMTILGLLLIVNSHSFKRMMSSWLSKQLETIPLPRFFRENIRQILDATSQYDTLPRSTFTRIWTFSVLAELLGILSSYLFVLALALQLSVINIGWVQACVLMVTMLPITLSGLGVRDGTFIYLLHSYGVLATDAVALSFLLFTRILVAGGIGGLLEAQHVFQPRRRPLSGKPI